MTPLFINLPVTDLERSKAFYTAVGFTLNPSMSDHNAACMVVEEGYSAYMLLVRDFFQTFTDRPIGDPAATVWGATAIFLESREAVDATLARGVEAGGSEAQPPSDYGFMYQRQLTDPDGHVLELGYMDPDAAAQGSEPTGQRA